MINSERIWGRKAGRGGGDVLFIYLDLPGYDSTIDIRPRAVLERRLGVDAVLDDLIGKATAFHDRLCTFFFLKVRNQRGKRKSS